MIDLHSWEGWRFLFGADPEKTGEETGPMLGVEVQSVSMPEYDGGCGTITFQSVTSEVKKGDTFALVLVSPEIEHNIRDVIICTPVRLFGNADEPSNLEGDFEIGRPVHMEFYAGGIPEPVAVRWPEDDDSEDNDPWNLFSGLQLGE